MQTILFHKCIRNWPKIATMSCCFGLFDENSMHARMPRHNHFANKTIPKKGNLNYTTNLAPKFIIFLVHCSLLSSKKCGIRQLKRSARRFQVYNNEIKTIGRNSYATNNQAHAHWDAIVMAEIFHANARSLAIYVYESKQAQNWILRKPTVTLANGMCLCVCVVLYRSLKKLENFVATA